VGLRLGKTGHQLVADVCPLVSHNRFRVRVAAVRTLTAIILTGSHEMILELVAHRDPNTIPIKAFYEGDTKVNFCARLATDRHAAVRVEFLTMLGEWLLKLPERRDHEQRLLPYVISLVNDEVDSISTRALEIMEALGAQYEADQVGKAPSMGDSLPSLHAMHTPHLGVLSQLFCCVLRKRMSA
jgi:hypothetical protein